MKIDIKKLLCLVTLVILVSSIDASALKTTDKNYQEKSKDVIGLMGAGVIPSSSESDDLDPLVDLAVTVTIKEIRALDKIDMIGNPDFYVKLIIDGVEHTSSIWRNQKYVESNWSATQDVPDDNEFVNITIQLWDKNVGGSKLCDISPNGPNVDIKGDREANLMYSLKSAHWTGDDYMGDPSGYGRLNGCDDNSIYQEDLDCELLFDITQNDYDGDGIPYWTEVNVFGTDPEVGNRGTDSDSDGVPIEWEFKWGHYFSYDWHHGLIENNWYYNPFVWEDHRHLDPDEDGLDNIEEYLTSQWGSDPFQKDLFVELDQMEAGPTGEPASIFPEMSKDLIKDAFDRQNIVFHLDDGCMGGGEWIPFDNETPREELVILYQDYFLHGDAHNWRKGVFHYGLVVYEATYSGYVFSTDDGYWGAFQISNKRMDKKCYLPGEMGRAITYASGYMHELGHTLNIEIPGGHDRSSQSIWQPGWWKWRPYKSCMNYGYVFFLVDYSDGSHGKNDHDDWSNLDLAAFQMFVE